MTDCGSAGTTMDPRDASQDQVWSQTCLPNPSLNYIWCCELHNGEPNDEHLLAKDQNKRHFFKSSHDSSTTQRLAQIDTGSLVYIVW